jgi:uncharacterized protein (DUF58 family)
MAEVRDFLDPSTVAQLEPLQVVAAQVVEGFLRGLHLSAAKGSSIEFAEHRAYVPGDEVRRIDWRNFARTDRYFVKEFEDETNLRAALVLDASASMGFGSETLTKLRYGACLAAALGYLLLLQRDAVGLAILDDGLRSYLPPKATAAQLSGIFAALEGAEARGRTALGRGLHLVAQHLPERSLAVVVSDLLDEPRQVLDGLARLRQRNIDVLLFHVMDPQELDLAFESWLVLRDVEAPEVELRVDPRQVRELYLQNLESHRHTLRQGSLACGVDYAFVETREPFATALARHLHARWRRA